MKHYKSFKATVLYLLVYLSLFASPVWADSPTGLFKSAVDQAINTLTDPYLQGENKKLVSLNSFLLCHPESPAKLLRVFSLAPISTPA